MDNPPPNYNPNESMLSGGVDMPIMKVMGGGGGINNEELALQSSLREKGFNVMLGGSSPPPNYNETVSMLDGGTEPIVMVKGGAIGGQTEGTPLLDTKPTRGLMKPDPFNDDKDDDKKFASFGPSTPSTPSKPVPIGNPVQQPLDTHEHKLNIRFVTHFDVVKPEIQQKFLNKISNLAAVNAKLEEEIQKSPEVNLAYIKNISNTYDITVISSDKNYEKVKFIPPSVSEIVVLPPTSTVEKFLEVLLYLTNNKYIIINEKHQLIIKKRVFIVHLMEPALLQSEQLKYLYLRLKVNNINKYSIADYPYKIIYPQLIDKHILLISNEGLKKPAPTYLEPINLHAIHDTFIKQMAYLASEEKYTNETFLMVQKGADSDDKANPILLTHNIAIIEVKEDDFNTIQFDINGITYRIRVPGGKNDVVYNLWLKEKYTPSETQLLHDLKITQTPYLNIIEKKAEILFELSYFKCFNDVSLLTSEECSSLRHTLQVIYKKKLKTDENMNYNLLTDKDKITIIKHKCYSVDIGNSIMCHVKYAVNNQTRKSDIKIPYTTNKDYVHKGDEESKKHISDAIMSELLKSHKQL